MLDISRAKMVRNSVNYTTEVRMKMVKAMEKQGCTLANKPGIFSGCKFLKVRGAYFHYIPTIKGAIRSFKMAARILIERDMMKTMTQDCQLKLKKLSAKKAKVVQIKNNIKELMSFRNSI